MVKSLPSTLVKSFLLISFLAPQFIAFNASAKSLDKRRDLLNERSNSSLCSRYFSIYEHRYHMPSNMLRAVSVTESGKWSKYANKSVAWPWTINVEGKGYHFDSRSEAIATVRKLMSEGKTSIDVGCMQINLKYHPDAFASLNQAFEPRYNIAYAAEFLNKKYKAKGNWETAIRHYHNANKIYSDKYLARVYETWNKEEDAINLAQLEKPATYITLSPRIKNNDTDVSNITQSALEKFNQ